MAGADGPWTAEGWPARTRWRTSAASTSTPAPRSGRSGSTSPSETAVVVPEGYGPMPAGYAFRVAQVDPPRALVLLQAPPEHPWNGVWSFHVVPAGEGRCPLLARSRTETAPRLGPRIATRVGEPVTLVMTRRMLHGIKQRSERRAAAG
jgi:hypothetical protein